MRTVAVGQGPAQPAPVKAPAYFRIFGALGGLAKTLVYTFVPVIMLAGLAAGIVYVRLRHGPISFNFVVTPIERGINAELVNNSVKIEGAELYLTETGALEFRLRQMTVFDADGDAIGGAPQAAVNISAAALWNLRIVPARVELIDPEINLVYTDADGLALDQVVRPAAGGESRPRQDKLSSSSDIPAERPISAVGVSEQSKAPPRQLNIAKMMSDASRRARKRLDATSYLVEFGVRNATINLAYGGQKSSWVVPEASVDFDHARRRSVISGRASVASPRGPWAVSFVTDETEKSGRLEVKATVRDLVPSSLAGAAPPLALLKMMDLPIAGDATVELSTDGNVEGAQIAIEAGAGRISHPDLGEPFNLTAALLKLAYSGTERTWQIQPSPIKWAEGNVLLSGDAKDVAAAGQPAQWQFAIDGKNGVIEPLEFSAPPVKIDVWTARGDIVPRRGLLQISEARFTGGGADIALSVVSQPGKTGQSTRADVAVSPMPLETLKAIWPRALAPGARSWVGDRVTAVTFKGGNVSYRTGDYLKDEAPALGDDGERLSATFEINDAMFIPLTGMAPISAPRGLVRLENNALEISVPEAAVMLPGNRRLPIKSGRLVAANVLMPRPESEISFTTQSPLGPFLEVVEQLPVRAVREAAPFPKAGDGKVDAQMKIKLPLVSKLNVDDVIIEGKAKITDGRFGKVGGQFDIQGFTLALDLTSTALDAKGDLLVNGVPGKIVGQRIFGVEGDQQPPMKVTANLDDADRNQLGLDINDIVRGVVPVEVSLQKAGRPEPVIKLKADLTNAEVVLEPVAWRKPAGKQAFVEADIANGKTHKTELQNLKISGDDIAVEGWVGIGADSRMREFYFPSFALNVVSRLEVQGTLGDDNIWAIKANGPNFDGRDVFKSLFSVGDGAQPKVKSAKSSKGTNLNVEIGNVIGGNDVSLRNFKMKLSTRSEKLSAFDAKGTLDGGAPLAAVLDSSTGTRRLLVDSTDAGQVLKLIDFYPNISSGRLQLEVNLDGKGAAEKTGVLWIERFKVLGDPIVSEVVGSADDGRPAIGGKGKVTREVFEFDRMRAPFSVGYGQFVLEESYVKGPVVGANLRGKVDFKTRRVNIGGTYIPLQGLNGALGGIPLLGQLISGAHGEGIFGITFAVQGPMADPQVLVNPLSLVAPGIFREMFQMTGQNPSVQVREERAPSKPVEQRVRASSVPAGASAAAPTGAVPATRTKPAKTVAPPPIIVDGWSSSTSDGQKKTN
ncbi:MAG: AsmA-like C-terminal region-containing protein [Hyphomicrobium sp.]